MHRSDGSPVIETAQDDRRAVLGVRDTERRVHHPAPLPPGGRDLRAGREVRPAQPQGPRLHHVEHRRAEPGRDGGVHRAARPPMIRAETGPASSSIRSTSPSRSSTTRPIPPAAWRHPLWTTDIAARTSSPRPRSTGSSSDGGQYTEYVFAGPDMPAILEVLHLADRADRTATALGARLSPVPLVRVHPGRCRGHRRRAPRQRHPL